MEKKWYILIIIALVMLELFTVAKLNLAKEEQERLQTKIEKSDEVISNLQAELKKYSDSPKDMLENARKAYYASDGDELADIYFAFRRYHRTAPEIDDVISLVKTLNGRINNEALRKARYSITADEQESNSVVVKMSKEQEADLQRVLSAAHKESELQRKYGNTAVEKASQGQIEIGWSKELCEAALGKPKSMATTTNTRGAVEQWQYEDKILIFIDGKLDSVTDFK